MPQAMPSNMPQTMASNMPQAMPSNMHFVNNILVENIRIRRDNLGGLVCSRLSAGLGNRIFQVLAALGYAKNMANNV